MVLLDIVALFTFFGVGVASSHYDVCGINKVFPTKKYIKINTQPEVIHYTNHKGATDGATDGTTDDANTGSDYK